MSKADPLADRQQSGGLCRPNGVGCDPEPLGSTPQQRRLADRLGRGDEQQPLGVRWEFLNSPPETVLNTARQLRYVQHTEPARKFGGRQAPRQLE